MWDSLQIFEDNICKECVHYHMCIKEWMPVVQGKLGILILPDSAQPLTKVLYSYWSNQITMLSITTYNYSLKPQMTVIFFLVLLTLVIVGLRVHRLANAFYHFIESSQGKSHLSIIIHIYGTFHFNLFIIEFEILLFWPFCFVIMKGFAGTTVAYLHQH